MFITPSYSDLVLTQINTTDLLLDLLKDKLVSPVVAGGAPRDWFFNHTAKDIDIFVNPQNLTNLLRDLTEILNVPLISKTTEELPEHYRSDYITAVITFKYNNIEFQIIIKNNTNDVLKDFPCSLSCISYSDFNIKPTQIFLNSIRNGVLYFKNTCNQKYERKMIKLFPTYKIQYRVNLIRSNTPTRLFNAEFGDLF